MSGVKNNTRNTTLTEYQGGIQTISTSQQFLVILWPLKDQHLGIFGQL